MVGPAWSHRVLCFLLVGFGAFIIPADAHGFGTWSYHPDRSCPAVGFAGVSGHGFLSN